MKMRKNIRICTALLLAFLCLLPALLSGCAKPGNPSSVTETSPTFVSFELFTDEKETQGKESQSEVPGSETIGKTMYLRDTIRARLAPDKDAKYDGKIEKGTAVKVLTRDTETNYCAFEYNGKTYYVNRQSLTDEKPAETTPKETEKPKETEPAGLDENKFYYSKEDVALYLHTFGHLPKNYITKTAAEAKGWDSSKGNLWDVLDGYCIGGDRFGNYEGKLPKTNGTYYECDVEYHGGYRGQYRLIFDKKGDVWYTGDHYNTFKKLY